MQAFIYLVSIPMCTHIYQYTILFLRSNKLLNIIINLRSKCIGELAVSVLPSLGKLAIVLEDTVDVGLSALGYVLVSQPDHGRYQSHESRLPPNR